MDNISQLQCEDTKQEGLFQIAICLREGTAQSCTIPGPKKGPASYQVFLALRRKLLQPTSGGLLLHCLVHATSGFSKDISKFLQVSLPQSFFISITPIFGWETTTKNRTKNVKQMKKRR